MTNARDPREFPTLYSEADINELGGLIVTGGAIGKALTNDDLSRHCGTGERQKHDDLSRHSGTQEVKHICNRHHFRGEQSFVQCVYFTLFRCFKIVCFLLFCIFS